MRVTPTSIPDVLVIEPDVHEDERGFFMETYQEKRYGNMSIETKFVQDNLVYSRKGVLRGLHYQHPHSQAKLIQVMIGKIFDVAVDIRKESPTFSKWVGAILSESNQKQLFIPTGFAHGYCVLSEAALVIYKCSSVYSPENEKGILWNDKSVRINWPVQNPIISPKDLNLPSFKELA